MDFSWAAYADFYQTQYKILSSDAIARKTVERKGLTAHPFFAVGDTTPSLYARVRALLPGAVAKGEQDLSRSRPGASSASSRSRRSGTRTSSGLVGLGGPGARGGRRQRDRGRLHRLQHRVGSHDERRGVRVPRRPGREPQEEIRELEEQLQGYGESKRIVSVDDESNITLKALTEIASKRTQAQTVLAEKEAAYRAALETPSAALPQVLESDLIARLKEEHASLEAEYSEKSRLFKDDWPGMQQLRSKLEQSESRLQEETEDIGTNVRRAAESAYRQAQGEVRSLTALLDGQRGRRRA
jgi:uncharacterized protein involved in exopolysaccharide biosynthesis